MLSDNQLSCQGVTHIQRGLGIVGKEGMILGYLNNGLKGCSPSPPSSVKTVSLIFSSLQGEQPTGHRLTWRTSRGTQHLSRRLQLPISWFSQLHKSLRSSVGGRKKNVASSPIHHMRLF